MRWFRLAVAFLKGPHLGSLFALVLAFWNGFVFVGPAVGLGQSDRWERAGGRIIIDLSSNEMNRFPHRDGNGSVG